MDFIHHSVQLLGNHWAVITTACGWAWGLWQFLKKRKAEKRQEIAEAQLVLIRRRASAPFLQPSRELFDRVFFDGSQPGEARFWHADATHVLSTHRDEVPKDTPEGTPVILVVSVSGSSARRVSVTLDGEEISIEQEPQYNFASGLTFLKYPYVPSRHGKEQKLAISFETDDGFQDTHIYRTNHGKRTLFRIDPP